MQNFDIFCSNGFFLFNTPLRISKQDINSFVSLALTIINMEVVTREYLNLTDLSGAQTLCVYELLEVVMISMYEDFMSKPL